MDISSGQPGWFLTDQDPYRKICVTVKAYKCYYKYYNIQIILPASKDIIGTAWLGCMFFKYITYT